MWVPLTILAAFAVLVGWVLEKTHAFGLFLGETPSLATAAVRATPAPGVFHMQIAVLSTFVALLGIAVAAFFYLGGQSEAAAVARRFDSVWLGKSYRWSRRKFFVDEIYDWLVVKPLAGVAQLSYLFDRYVVDGLVNGCGHVPKAIGGKLRGLQMGLVPFYGLAMVLGLLTLLAVRVLLG
jgi:NADH-quinone oxidoreductase subunit L